MEKINLIKEIINDRFKGYPELKLPNNINSNPNYEYAVEYIDNKYIISYYDWRTKKEIFQSIDEQEVIRELTLIFTDKIALDFTKSVKLKYIDTRIFWFAKHVELLIEFKEFEMAKIKMKEYSALLGYNIFDSNEEIMASLSKSKD